MKVLTTSRIVPLFVLLAASSALLAQDSALRRHPTETSVLDAREIVTRSIAAAERSWQARGHYIYVERDEDRRLNSSGQVESQNIDVARMTVVNGARFEQLLEHNGQLPTAKDRRKSEDDLEKLKHESSAEQAARLSRDQENRSFLEEMLQAFDFQLAGEEIADGRPAYLLLATPRAGYRAKGKYGKMLSKVEGKLWVDKQDFGWIKVDGRVTQSFSIGLFAARVQRGSHILLEQNCIGDAVWVPTRLEIRASAKILFLKNLEMDRILTYSDYHLATDGPYSVSR
jgi:hypothetical protein